MIITSIQELWKFFPLYFLQKYFYLSASLKAFEKQNMKNLIVKMFQLFRVHSAWSLLRNIVVLFCFVLFTSKRRLKTLTVPHQAGDLGEMSN